MKPFCAAIVLFFAAPGVAVASSSLVARDLPARSGVVAKAPAAFDLVGMHWRGSGVVRFRTQRADGTWSKWRLSAPEDDLPDRNTAEGRRSRGWHLGNPFWVGRSERIQYRLGGHVQRLRAFFVRSPLLGGTPQHVKPFTENAPPIITRAEWGANEAIRRNKKKGPKIADNVHIAFVHHTAGTNNYSRSQSARGSVADLRAISGHRDTYPTSCPGNNVYAQLPSITRQVAATGLPKIYSPLVLGGVGGNVRFAARLSSAVPWTVTVADSLGRVVASGTGTSSTLDWTWDASLVVPGRYTYTMAAGGGGAAAARPVRGLIGTSPPPVTVTQFRVEPAVVSPNGDGVGDAARITYFLSASAPITLTLADASGHQLATLFSGIVSQGSHSFVWSQVGIPNGRYSITISASTPSGKKVTSKTTFYVDRTLAQVKLSAPAISPNGDGVFDDTSLSFRLDAAASVRVELWRAQKLVGTLVEQALGIGPAQIAWNGRLGSTRVADGSYELVLKAKDAVTTITQRLPIVVDTKPPRLRLVSRRRAQFWTNEPATVTASSGVRRVTKHVHAGYFSLPFLRRARHFTVTASDAVGNKTPPLRA